MASTVKTIARNATKQIAYVREHVTSARVYTLDNQFQGQNVDPRGAFAVLAQYRNARLVAMSDGTWRIRLHSNCWYVLSR